ncbi:radical SAM protein [Pseudarthrobacter sp. BIM B-2242]|uniref:radical SAM protein n=1 Tax=Pseudarthrobacter sp. BIM B-2242 TaxID=2772401 RepID=UPI001CC3D584|nr:radical SAM protein [Pseudarthrobacter sp. BIM B-2242]
MREVSAGFGHRVLQVHPTLRCNLKCTHCYSSSSPANVEEMDVEPLRDAITAAAHLGFQSMSVSGGEPLMYRGLDELLAHARSIGMRTGVVTNGALVSKDKVKQLAALVDVVAVSLDGPKDLHNRIRGSHQSYDRALRALALLAEAGVSTAVLHTVTKDSLPFVADLVSTAREHGAAVVRLHPLELYGRAAGSMGGQALDEGDKNRLYLQALALDKLLGGGMRVETDLILRAQILGAPERVYASPFHSDGSASGVGLIDTLVLGADGDVIPVAYGMNSSYRICSLRESGLADGFQNFVDCRYEGFLNLCRSLYQRLESESRLVVNWHELLVAASNKEPLLAAAG